MSAILDLLSVVPEDKRDQLFKLLEDGPMVVEELTGEPTHRSKLHRMEAKGSHGVRLQTVTVGRSRFSTRRWLLEFFAAVDVARRENNAPAPKGQAKRTTRTRRTNRTKSAADKRDDILDKYGMGKKTARPETGRATRAPEVTSQRGCDESA